MNDTDIKNLFMRARDPVLKLEILMDLGKTLDAVPGDAICTEIYGCASRVMICRAGDVFYGTADSAMVRGILALILNLIHEKSFDEIRNMNLKNVFAELDINLGAGRTNGVNSMISFFENL